MTPTGPENSCSDLWMAPATGPAGVTRCLPSPALEKFHLLIQRPEKENKTSSARAGFVAAIQLSDVEMWTNSNWKDLESYGCRPLFLYLKIILVHLLLLNHPFSVTRKPKSLSTSVNAAAAS